MNSFAPSIDRLIEEFAKLPSIGRKTAQRLAFHLLKRPAVDSGALSSAILDAKAKVRPCSLCHNYCEKEICPVCADPKRDRSRICVVEQPSDIYAFEKMGNFRGLYHVLGGALSPLDGITQDELRMKELLERIDLSVQEVIVATNSSSAGEATALYLTKILRERPVRITRLARGIPMGSEIEFADEVTLFRAFEDRMEI